MAKILADAGQFSYATRMIKKAKKLIPDLTKMKETSLIELGYAQYRVGQFEESTNTFKVAANIYPSDPTINNDLGFILLLAGKFTPASKYLRRCISLDKEYARGYFNLAVYYFSKSNDIKGIEEYKKGIQINVHEAHEHLNDLRQFAELHPQWTWVARAMEFLEAILEKNVR